MLKMPPVFFTSPGMPFRQGEVLVAAARGPYDHEWRILSEQLRASHPWCVLCHAAEGEEYMDARGNVRVVRLTVDHINGRPWDNRRENLRVLCAACHGSLTSDNWRR